MKTVRLAVGAGIGYLAGNEDARNKIRVLAERAWAAPQTRAVERKLLSTAQSIGGHSSEGGPPDPPKAVKKKPSRKRRKNAR